MKPDLSRPTQQPQYRNEAVFESAQRLLATKPPAKPSPWKFIAGGAGIGLGLGFLGLALWNRADPDGLARLFGFVSPSKQALAIPGPAATDAAKAAPVAAVAPHAPAEADAAGTGPVGNPRLTEKLAEMKAELEAPKNLIKTADAFGTTIAPTASEIVWIGELLSESGDSAPVEFVFRPVLTPGKDEVRGLVRIGGVIGNTIVGDIENHTLVLRETETMWAFSNGIPADSPLLRSGRQFVIPLPQAGATQLTGTWSFNGASGPVKLTLLRVW